MRRRLAARMAADRPRARTTTPTRMQAPGDPPRCPPGWATGPPDFVGVGAQRAGTSRWYGLISAHPQVQRGPKKELHFFDRFGWWDDPDVARYVDYFPRPPGKITGEWTPSYMVDHWTPHLLAKAAPETRLIVSLRDPVDRYLSALRLRLTTLGAGRSTGDPQEVLGTSSVQAVFRGLYAPQMQQIRRHFPRSRILVLQFERCVRDPQAELRRTYEFLGIDPDYTPKEERATKKVNAKPVPIVMPDEHRRALAAYLEEDVRQLVAEYPEIDLSLWPNFEHLAKG